MKFGCGNGLLGGPEGEHDHGEEELVLELAGGSELRQGVEAGQGPHPHLAVQLCVPVRDNIISKQNDNDDKERIKRNIEQKLKEF